jgi:hypothetical protein
MTHSSVQQVANPQNYSFKVPNALFTLSFVIAGQLPLLKDGPVWVAGASRIIAHLSKNGHNGNASLSAEQIADSLA